MKNTFYITTAIDYPNGLPHIGHAYEKIFADVISRYKKYAEKKVCFMIGVDQHGQKIQQKAATLECEPSEYVKSTTKEFINLWEKLSVDYDLWAETTDQIHHNVVRAILQKFYEEGKIYKKTTSGFYSVRQEQFLTDKEKNEKGEFDSKWGEVIHLEEENYYFKLSDSFKWLKNYLEINSKKIIPSYRTSDVLNALEVNSNEDLCISRPKKRLSWGIELPFDKEFVTYVWFDALVNYLSFAGYLKEKVNSEKKNELPDFDSLWPCDIQIIGKDILRPAHGIYWLIMLHSMGFSDDKIPTLLVHGWWNIKSSSGKTEKMSKSLGNVIDPLKLCEEFGSDTLRYYLTRDIYTGKDSNFDLERLKSIYNSELANGLGNLINRSLSMSIKYRKGIIAKSKNLDKLNEVKKIDDSESEKIRTSLENLIKNYIIHMENYEVNLALEKIYSYVTLCNQYVEKTAPWTIAKNESENGDKEKLDNVLHHLCESVVHIALLLAPMLPKSFLKIKELFEYDFSNIKLSNQKWGILPDQTKVLKPTPIFPRID